MNEQKNILLNINKLGTKVNELMNKNKVLNKNIEYYKKLFSSNKKHMSTYFNSVSDKKEKKNNINKIKQIIVDYNSEIKKFIRKQNTI